MGYGQAAYGQPQQAYAPGPPQAGPQAPYGQGYGQPPAYGQQPYAQQPYGSGTPAYAPRASGIGGGKPIGTIITEAFALYQKNVVALFVTCAILLAPISLAKSAAMAMILAPTVAATEVAVHSMPKVTPKTAAEWQREIQAAQGDPKKLQQIAAERQKEIADLGRAAVATGGAVVGTLLATILAFFATMLGIVLMIGLAIPLVTGALTIIVADRATGGDAGPGLAYKLVFKRLGKLLSALIPAFFIVFIGFCLLVLPGLIASFLFTFVAPVVLLENVGGFAALGRSVSLVKANALQVFVVGLVFGAIRFVTTLTAHLFIPHTAFFLDSLVQDALLMLLLPIPVIGAVLLYLDIRRQADGLDERGVRGGIEALRQA